MTDNESITEPGAQDQAPAPGPANEPAKKAIPRRVKIIGAAAVGALIFGGIITAVVVTAMQPSKLVAAVEECGVDDEPYVSVGDDGASLFIDGAPESGIGGLDYAGTACVLHVLDAPDSTLNLIGQTRALDGRQIDDWDDVEASWTYHPENGLDILFELN